MAAGRSGEVAIRTALVVVDDPERASAIGRMLERNGFVALSAVDGPAAVAFSKEREGDIDLLLTDSLMPAMPGVELAEAIRLQRPGIAVVYLSEFAPDSFGAARPRAVLQTPFDEAELLEVLHRHLPD